MKKALASAGLLALGAAASQTVLAQATGAPPKPWSVSGTLRGFYDDNINTAPSGPAKQSSIGYEIKPYGEVNLSSGPTVFTASYFYDLRYYEARASGKAEQDHDLELLFKHAFSERYSMDLGDSFVIAQEPEILTSGGRWPLPCAATAAICATRPKLILTPSSPGSLAW